ncbi:MAG: ABC transporter, solute-binding protein [Microgenomates group bacterium GW2011_GWA1_48_10]|uniref:ABC transporter substrate-binding protein n=1 Tax=Candidatus Gottesmanbacteria bacterium RIFCSPHIGHO2_01_FULL_47_48 TaxID=1798381 RepID=A0A1F6A168_9BACT|nr:MAG: ABC transporter, solute-binding protein [Microgenomates group bacterium GW2011_GWA1_48_10]OGG18430.1 MAG: hypothetical protein A2721_01430 [Candidatus Gottesmanbacteria bacterium RIFCSPHIGHO2_01_FULL_47_48]
MDKKVLILIGIVFIILIIAGAATAFFLFKQTGPVTLTYWGLWEPESVFSEVISDYERTHPKVKVKYQKASPIQYRERMMTAISKDGGPDIVRIHNSWLPMLKNSLQAAPTNVFPAEEFQKTFYPVASADFVADGRVWAVPLEIDTLAMYVNEDVIRAGGVAVPTTWEEFSPVASRLTVRDSAGRIQTAGTSLGGAANVDHWQEILGLMTLQATTQTGASVNAGNSQAAVEAMQFYTSFESIDRDWDETLDASTLAFGNGKVGFYFGPSWRYFDIKDISQGKVNFSVAPVPQLTGGTTVNFATYWAEAVSKKSPHGKEAFEFLKYLSSKEVLTKLYAAETSIRGFGEPYSRVDMASLLATDPVGSVVISQAPTAKSWYLAGYTNDGETGINSKVGKYYLDAVNAVNQGSEVAKVMETVAAGLAQVLGSYGIR